MICVCMYLSFRVRSENWKTGLERKLIRGNWFKIRQPRLLVNIIRATAIRVRIFGKYLAMYLFLSFSFLFFLSVFFFICCLKYSKTSRLILGDPGAVSRAGRKGATKVFKYKRKSPWVPSLTGPFPNGQANAGS